MKKLSFLFALLFSVGSAFAQSPSPPHVFGAQETLTHGEVNWLAQTVDTVAALRVAAGTPGMSVLARGRLAPGDGGGGQFFWSAASNATDDGANVLEPVATPTGRWLRATDGPTASSSAPPGPYVGELWFNTALSPIPLDLWDGANWEALGTINSGTGVFSPANALIPGNNLSDLTNAAVARASLGVSASGADTGYAWRNNNLSDLTNFAAARASLGVSATGADTTYAYRANNLSDLTSALTARYNLGLSIGTNVEAWNANLDTYATKSPPGGAVVGTTDTQTLTNKSIAASEVNSGTLAAAQMPAFSGDASTSPGSTVLTLATVNSSPGTCTNATVVVNGKGQTTGCTSGTAAATAVAPPQGRIYLVSGVPVQTADEVNKSTIYYGDYLGGNAVPYYTGSGDALDTIPGGEVSDALQASGTGVLNANDAFDVWWVHSGTNRICVATNGSGAGWSSVTGGSLTSRGTGGTNTAPGAGIAQLDLVSRPYPTNKNSITHCYNGSTDYGPIAANQASYEGGFKTTAAGQTGVALNPAAAAGGSNPCICVFNAFNRVPATSVALNSTASWTYATATWRAANGSNSMRVSWFDGLGVEQIAGEYVDLYQDTGTGSGNGDGQIGVDFDSTSATPGGVIGMSDNGGGFTDLNQIIGDAVEYPVTGFHYEQAVENVPPAASVSFYGSPYGMLIWKGQM